MINKIKLKSRIALPNRLRIGVTAVLCIMGTAVMSAADSLNSKEYLAFADSADIYIGRQDWEKAENSILKALRTEPGNVGNVMLISNLGIIRNRLEHYDEARESFDIVLSRLPKSTVALTGRAESYIGLKQYANALSDLDKALDTDSTLTVPLAMRGYLLLKLNRPEEAFKSFSRVVNLDSVSATGHAGLGDALANLGRNREAVSEYLKAIENEDRAEWRFRAGLLLLEEDNLEGAAEQAAHVLAQNPKDGDIYILMALIHKRRFETREAEIAEKMARDFGASPELILYYLDKKKPN